MKFPRDSAAIRSLAPAQAGVFSIRDLQSVLGEKHKAGLVRRIQTLEREGVLERFIRGWYVTPGSFDLPTLSQRIAPESYVSFGQVLAQALVVGPVPGPVPEKEVWAAKPGRSRTYCGAACRVLHLGIDSRLSFGFEERGAVCWATPEKALLDVLYFHQRRRRFSFDIYSDLHLAELNRNRLSEYLSRYRNPRFTAFVRGVLDAAA